MLGYICRFKLKNALKAAVFAIGAYILLQIIFKYYSTSVKSYPIILWWTPFMAENEKIIKCFDTYSCMLTKDRKYRHNINTKAFLFYGSSFNSSDLPVPKNQSWALFHEESPRNNAVFLYNKTQQLFDFRATFSNNAEMPLTLQYLENIKLLTDTQYLVDIQEKNKLLNSIAPLVYIQSDCDTPNERDNYVIELMKYIRIDSYGSCLKNKEFPKELSNIYKLDLYNEKLLNFIARYKFVISFENAICDDYITEKLWRPLIVGSVPIYMGSPRIKKWLPNENSAILVQNFTSSKSLAEFVYAVNLNDDLYQSFLQHKRGVIENQALKSVLDRGPFGLYTDQDHPILAFECEICKSVHEGFKEINRKTVYNCPEPTNSWNFFWKNGKCEADALERYVKHGGNYEGDKCMM